MDSVLLRKLTESAQQVVAGGRIGIPSVVRWYVRTSVDEADPAASARAMLRSAGVWLGGEPASVRTFVRENGSEAVIHATWPAGAAAILAATQGPGEPANDLILLGSRGAIYFGRTPEAGSS